MSLRPGRTPVEVISLFIVAGLFLATVVHESAVAPGEGRAAALRDGLEVLRTAVEMYRYQHQGDWPAAGTTDADAFEAALLRVTDADGREVADGRCGPYVVGRLPINPYNGLRTVRVVTGGESAPADDTTGWTYDSITGTIQANSVGRDDEGRRLSSL